MGLPYTVNHVFLVWGMPEKRNALYMPAVVAMRYNPLLKTFSERLLARGKVKMLLRWGDRAQAATSGFWDFKIPKTFRP